MKFTPAGGRIVVRTRDAGGHLTIEVSDTGIGFVPEIAGSMFLPFDQGGLERARLYGGLGLGLSIAKAIVELHGGTLHPESAGPGRGANFRVELQTVDTPGDLPEASSREASLAPPSSGLQLLLVEDHEATLTILARLLRRAGHAVITAMSATAAREVASRERFDAVISDIGLPDGTGIELMEFLHRAHGLRGIALSGYGMDEDLRRSREVGFVTHLVKPVDFAQLRHALGQFAAEFPSGQSADSAGSGRNA